MDAMGIVTMGFRHSVGGYNIANIMTCGLLGTAGTYDAVIRARGVLRLGLGLTMR